MKNISVYMACIVIYVLLTFAVVGKKMHIFIFISYLISLVYGEFPAPTPHLHSPVSNL